MIYYYKLVLQYKGTRYLGWQVQPEGAGQSVQGELNKALKSISKGQVHSMGAGRTDAGVHALGQVAKVGIELNIVPEKLLRALNSHLPTDIRIIDVENSNYDFLPTVHALSKEYHYRFTCGTFVSPFQNEFIVNQSFDLDFEKMNLACKKLIGEHDFRNYFCEGTAISSTIRKIFECEIVQVAQGEFGMLPEHHMLRIVGNGFLKQMVRLLMGAIWNVGRGKISIEEFALSLTGRPTQRLGAVAPPQGLYMFCVNYEIFNSIN